LLSTRIQSPTITSDVSQLPAIPVPEGPMPMTWYILKKKKKKKKDIQTDIAQQTCLLWESWDIYILLLSDICIKE
jgi:hypothetical protein